MTPLHHLLLYALAFTAGFIDAIAGGGGLIQMPALLILVPGLPIPTLMGTNKFAAFSGTSLATVKYIRNVDVPWKTLIPAFVTALIFSFTGAHMLSLFPKEHIKLVVVILLSLVAIYTFLRKNFGLHHAPKVEGGLAMLYAALAGAAMGFYDGFFGPGTGSFLIVIFVSIFGYSFLVASGSAKLVNCATNLAALAYFMYTGQVLYALAIPIALCNMTGAFLGARIALKKGVGFVRVFFLLMVSAMIIKLALDLI